MLSQFLLALAFFLPKPGVIEDRFDKIEVNIVCNEFGKPFFAQVICYDWVYVAKGKREFKVQYWETMHDAWSSDDPKHRERWEKMVEDIVSGVKEHHIREDIRYGLKYRGKFVGGKKMPRKNRHGHYEIIYLSNRTGVIRKVTAPVFVLHYSHADPERLNRLIFPESSRRGLTKPAEVTE